MALNYDDLMATSVVDLEHSYRDVHTMLYAVSVGMGRDAVNPAELAVCLRARGAAAYDAVHGDRARAGYVPA